MEAVLPTNPYLHPSITIKKPHTYNSYNIDTLGKANGSKTGIQTYIHWFTVYGLTH